MAGMLPQQVVRFPREGSVAGSPRRVHLTGPPPETQWRPLHGLPRFCEAGTGGTMRFILGILIGCALTIGGAYTVDTVSTATAEPVLVNWDVVAKNLDAVTTLARAGWKKIAG